MRARPPGCVVSTKRIGPSTRATRFCPASSQYKQTESVVGATLWCLLENTHYFPVFTTCSSELRGGGWTWLRSMRLRPIRGQFVTTLMVRVRNLLQWWSTRPRVASQIRSGHTEGNAYAEFKKKQKDKVKRFVTFGCQDRLVVARICLMLSMLALHWVEDLGSDSWHQRQQLRHLNGERFANRMTWAHSGALEANVLEGGNKLLDDASSWSALRPSALTLGLAALAFVQISVVVCAFEQLLFSRWRTYPCRLFLLLDPEHCNDVAAELLQLPVCCLDEFTRRRRRRFYTEVLLLSDKCQALLLMLGEACRLDICRIECRHAQLRRFSRSSSTWLPHLGDLSAHFVLVRQRMLGKLRSFLKSGKSSKEKRKRREGRARRRKGRGRTQTRGGGGAWRAHISETIRGRRFDSDEARGAAFRDAQSSYALQWLI